MGRTSLANYFQYAIGGVAGIGLTVYTSKYVSSSQFSNLFEYIGRYTLPIMLFHFAVFYIIEVLISLVCVTAIPLYIVKIIKIVGAIYIPICIYDLYHNFLVFVSNKNR